MAGTVIRVIPKRTLDFSSVTSGQSEEIILAQGIDVSEWREITLMVRTHATTFSGAIGNIQVYALLEGRTNEDPGILFVTTTALGTVTIDSTTVAPAYSVNGIPSNAGSMIKIAAKGTRTAAGTSIKADVSIDLSLKSA